MMNSVEINFASNILTSIVNSTLTTVTSAFLSPLSLQHTSMAKITPLSSSLCLTEMLYKMRNSEYQNIKEFVCDFRLMLFNHYRFLGCDSKVGKLAAKLEAMFEQKLLLLPIDIRLKTSMDAILSDDIEDSIEAGMSRRRNGFDRSFNTDTRMRTPVKAIMEELEKCGTLSTMFPANDQCHGDPIDFITVRLMKWQEKRRQREMVTGFDDWFIENTCDRDRRVLETCPEFIEFLQFLNLAYFALGLDQLLSETIYLAETTTMTVEDVQYAVLFPRTSRLLAAIVSLLTTKSKFRLQASKGPLLDYCQWNRELAERLDLLYSSWTDKHMCDSPHLFVKRYGVDTTFFKVLGHKRNASSRKKMFHELSVFQRCHVLLAMCYMTLKGQDSVHSAIDKSIEWEEHKRIVLCQVGQYEYVRFSGLGLYSSYYIYRVRVVALDSELSSYSVQELAPSLKKRRKEQPLDKYRVPSWHLKEVRKSKTKKAIRERKKKQVAPVNHSVICVDNKDCAVKRPTRSKCTVNQVLSSSSLNNNEDSIDQTYQDLEDTVITKSTDIIESIPTSSISTNDNETDNNIITNLNGTYNNNNNKLETTEEQDEEEEEEQIFELTEPIEGDLELLAKDLKGVTILMREIKEKVESLCDEEEKREYRQLLESLEVVRLFFEEHDGALEESLKAGKLRLRQEIEGGERNGDEGRSLVKEEVGDDGKESEGSGDRYTESEIRVMNLRRMREGDNGPSNKRWKEMEDEEEEEEDEIYVQRPVKKQRRIIPITNNNNDDEYQCCSENRAPLGNDVVVDSLQAGGGGDGVMKSSENQHQKVKRKVFQIYNDFFTDELVPVRVKADGSLESLPLESVTEERYALARKMIDLYKHKLTVVPVININGDRV